MKLTTICYEDDIARNFTAALCEIVNTTVDKMAAQNLNIIRKWSLSILKPAEISRHKLSMRKKRFVVSLRPMKYLEELLEA